MLNKVKTGYNVMERDWIVSGAKNECFLSEESNVTVNSEEWIGYFRIPDVIDEVSHKPMSL